MMQSSTISGTGHAVKVRRSNIQPLRQASASGSSSCIPRLLSEPTPETRPRDQATSSFSCRLSRDEHRQGSPRVPGGAKSSPTPQGHPDEASMSSEIERAAALFATPDSGISAGGEPRPEGFQSPSSKRWVGAWRTVVPLPRAAPNNVFVKVKSTP